VNLVLVVVKHIYHIYRVIILFDFFTYSESLDYQLLGCDMQRNKVNKWAWHKRFRFSTTFCVPLIDVSAVYDGVSASRKCLALECAQN